MLYREGKMALGKFKPSFRSGFGLVLDVVLGTGFDKFWEGENHGFGLTPPDFRWFSPVLELSRRTAEFQFSIGRAACHRITEISCNDRCGASTNGAPTSSLGPPACSSRLTCHKFQRSCGILALTLKVRLRGCENQVENLRGNH